VGEAFYLLNCRSLDRSLFAVGLFSNTWIWVGTSAMAILQLLFTYLPMMNHWFSTVPISAEAWLRVLACSLLMSMFFGIEKCWRSQHKVQELVQTSLAGKDA